MASSIIPKALDGDISSLNDALTNISNRLVDIRFVRLPRPGSNATFTVTVSGGNERHFLFTSDSNAAKIAIIAIWTTGTGNAGESILVGGSGITTSHSGSSVTLTFTSSSNPYMIDMIVYGNTLTIS